MSSRSTVCWWLLWWRSCFCCRFADVWTLFGLCGLACVRDACDVRVYWCAPHLLQPCGCAPNEKTLATPQRTYERGDARTFATLGLNVWGTHYALTIELCVFWTITSNNVLHYWIYIQIYYNYLRNHHVVMVMIMHGHADVRNHTCGLCGEWTILQSQSAV